MAAASILFCIPVSAHRVIDVNELEPYGHDLHRPECVIARPDGDVFVPDWRGGITRIAADGSQDTWLARQAPAEVRPNGIAQAGDGSFLIANLGDQGGVWRLRRDGRLEPFVIEVDGLPLPPANFVLADGQSRTWISVSTRQVPRQNAWRPDFGDGFIVLHDRAGARIVADGLHYTNEVKPDPTGAWLYVVETFGRRLTRFRITPDGHLNGRETLLAFGHGVFPDGFAFDTAGGVWVTSLISNRLLRFDGETVQTILEDVNPAYIDSVEQAFAAGHMKRDHLGPIPGTKLQQVTSLAFGGGDRTTVYLGSLHSDCLYRFRADVAGAW